MKLILTILLFFSFSIAAFAGDVISEEELNPNETSGSNPPDRFYYCGHPPLLEDEPYITADSPKAEKVRAKAIRLRNNNEIKGWEAFCDKKFTSELDAVEKEH